MVACSQDFVTKLSLRPEHAVSVIERLERDASWLADVGLMDYSLLVGVHNIPFNVNPMGTLRKRQAHLRASQGAASRAPSGLPSRGSGGDLRGSALPSAADGRRSAPPPHLLPTGLLPTDLLPTDLQPTDLDGVAGVGATDRASWRRPSFEGSEASENDSEGGQPVGVLPRGVTDFGAFAGFMQPDPDGFDGGDFADGGVSGSFGSAAAAAAAAAGSGVASAWEAEDWEGALGQQLADAAGAVFQARVVVGGGLFYVGIVDTLTPWTWRRQLERWAKATFCVSRADANGLSCAPPLDYAARFKRKVREVVEHDFVRQVPSRAPATAEATAQASQAQAGPSRA